MRSPRLSELQQLVLWSVRDPRARAYAPEIARDLDRRPAAVQKALNALTRRNFVTPMEEASGREYYVPTQRGLSA